MLQRRAAAAATVSHVRGGAEVSLVSCSAVLSTDLPACLSCPGKHARASFYDVRNSVVSSPSRGVLTGGDVWENNPCLILP